MEFDHTDVAVHMARDERILPSNVALAWAIFEDLQETLEKASVPFDIYQETWKLFALYYGARILGAFGGNIATSFHTFGREAAYLDRAIYEFFTKLLYYTTLRHRAREALDAFPKAHAQLFRRLNLEPTKLLSPELLEIMNAAPIYKADEVFKKMHEELLADEAFKKMTHKAAVAFYLDNPEREWNIRWILPSQVVHGSIVDLFASSQLDWDKPEITGELDSLRPVPNRALLEMAQYALCTTRHFETGFGLGESPHAAKLTEDLQSALRAVEQE
jgi:hypothetical protein